MERIGRGDERKKRIYEGLGRKPETLLIGDDRN